VANLIWNISSECGTEFRAAMQARHTAVCGFQEFVNLFYLGVRASGHEPWGGGVLLGRGLSVFAPLQNMGLAYTLYCLVLLFTANSNERGGRVN
jgi:hypothetical protein